MKLSLPILVTAGLVVGSLCAAQTIQTKPVQPTTVSGSEMFHEYCAVCHGNTAKGDGPAATAMKKTPSDLTELAARNKGSYPARHVYNIIKGDPDSPIAHGTKDMPVWGTVFGSLARGNPGEVQLRISNLVDYVKTLQVQK